MKKKRSLKKSNKIFRDAKELLVGGVNSPVRAFTCIGGMPVPIKSGCGSKVYDYDGNEYIDYVLSYGVHVLGHRPKDVIDRIKKEVSSGISFGATHHSEIELARSIRKAIPLFKKIRFTTSGTEAVMGALRLARGVTGRNKILKFENSYHGHADYLLAKAGSGLATMKLPLSKGVPGDFLRHTLVANKKDPVYINSIFKRYGDDIAAIIVEPVGGNYGVTLPDIGFLKYLRSITKQYKALLIFDEVITGFRFHFGSAADLFGITPDLICLGKIIGGGLPIGAYGGKESVMKHLAPCGGVYQASTLSGNPIVMGAGIETLRLLSFKSNEYKRFSNITRYISESLKEIALSYGIKLSVCHFYNMFSIHFKKKNLFKLFHRRMLENGIYLAPSEYEANFASFAHSKKDIHSTIKAAEIALSYIKNKGG